MVQNRLPVVARDIVVLESLWWDGVIGMALVGQDGRFLAVNPALSLILEYSEPELLSMKFQDVTPDRLELSADEVLLEDVVNGGRTGYDMVKSYRTKTGKFVTANLRVSGVFCSEGEFLFLLSQVMVEDPVPHGVRKSPRAPTLGDWLNRNKWAYPILGGAITSFLYTILEIYAAFRSLPHG